MKKAQVLQEIQKMRFKEVYEQWALRALRFCRRKYVNFFEKSRLAVANAPELAHTLVQDIDPKDAV